jgi:hypothetical protein
VAPSKLFGDNIFLASSPRTQGSDFLALVLANRTPAALPVNIFRGVNSRACVGLADVTVAVTLPALAAARGVSASLDW